LAAAQLFLNDEAFIIEIIFYLAATEDYDSGQRVAGRLTGAPKNLVNITTIVLATAAGKIPNSDKAIASIKSCSARDIPGRPKGRD
jgi:hypothetical protein